MVQFKTLRNGEGEERRVREVCSSGNMSVIVYEPSKEDVNTLLRMQEDMIETDSSGEVKLKVGESQMIREIYPMLTDLEGFEDLTDEDIEDITDNPSIALIQATSVITQIILEVYKITILSVRQQMVEQDFEFETFRFNQHAAQKIMTTVSALDGIDGIEKQTKEAEKELDELSARRHEKEMAKIFEETQEFLEIEEASNAANKSEGTTTEKENTSSVPMTAPLNPGDETPEDVIKRMNKVFDINVNND